MGLKAIEFTFENCEVISIPKKYIGIFSAKKFKTSYTRLGDNISRIDVCRDLLMEIHRDANNIVYHPFGLKDTSKVFDVFSRNDLCQIEFIYENEDGSEARAFYHIKWFGDDDYTNLGQSTYISKPGHCYVAVNKHIYEDSQNVKDYFENWIDNEEKTEDHFEWIMVGDKYGE